MLPGAENLLDDKFYKKQAIDRHHRYISVPERGLPRRLRMIRNIVHPAAKAFGNREPYFIPRSYGVFIKTDESIYVHVV